MSTIDETSIRTEYGGTQPDPGKSPKEEDSVLSILNQMMNVCIPGDRANRDFWVKFPEEVRDDTLGGQLWFGAECLAAGSIILNQEVESVAMRPLAQQLTSCMEEVRSLARQQALRDVTIYPEALCQALRRFDGLMAEFELRYVSAMVPVQSVREYGIQQDITVLFCETTTRALKHGYISQAMLDEFEPALMITIPRLAIVCGLLVYPDGPLQLDGPEEDMSELFRPFHSLLRRIRDLLKTLKEEELQVLEHKLCVTEEEELLAVRRRSSAAPLTMASSHQTSSSAVPLMMISTLQMSSSPLTTSTPYNSPSSLHSPVSRTFCPVPVFSVSSSNPPRPLSSFPTSTSAIKNTSPHDTVPLPGSTQVSPKASLPTPVSNAERRLSSFVLSQAQPQQQREGIQAQMEMPPCVQTQDWSGREGLETGDRDETPSSPPFLQVSPNHVHPRLEVNQLLSSPRHSGTTTHSRPHLESDCKLSCSVQSDVTEMEQLSRMFHMVEDEMNSFLWPPSQNSSPLAQRRREIKTHRHSPNPSPFMSRRGEKETHSRSPNPSPFVLKRGGTKSYRPHYSSSPSLSRSVSPNLGHENRSNRCRTQSPLTRGCRVSPRSRSSNGSLGHSSSVEGDLLGPGCSEESVFSTEDFVTNTNSLPSSPLLGLKQGLKQDVSLHHETYLEVREDASFTSSPLSGVQEGLRNDPARLPFPLLRVKRGVRSGPSSGPSSPHLGARHHHSSLPCSPMLRVKRGASSCPSSPRISLSRLCIEAALERSKNLRNRDSQPEMHDFCSRSKAAEDEGEKIKSQKKKEEEEEDEARSENEAEGARVAEVIAVKISGIRVSATVIINPTSSHKSLSKVEREEVGEGEEGGEKAVVLEEEEGDSKLHHMELQQPKYCELSPCVCFRCPSAPPFENPGQGVDLGEGDKGPASRIYPCLNQWITNGDEGTEMMKQEKRERRQTRKNTSETTVKDSDVQMPRNSIRSRFHSSDDLLHRLFVCISGVADQLQSNYASDLRAILKTLFDTMTTKTILAEEDKQRKASLGLCDWTLKDCSMCREWLNSLTPPEENGQCEGLPFWVPDESCSFCSACSASFSVIRRKHHCRSCGKIFCSRCSAHSAPLPRYGQVKPVRVCTHCYLFHVTPFCHANGLTDSIQHN